MMQPKHTSAVLSSTPPRLSKSKFLSGLQCLKRVYLEVHHPELATPPDASTQAILDMGTEIGELARRRFPGGRLVTAGYRQQEAAVAETLQLVRDPAVQAIFEGAFVHDGVLVRVDVLERVEPAGEEAGWRLIEVKSATRVKDVHLDDLAIQSQVVLGSGHALSACCLMHINADYEYKGGDVDLMELFSIDDVTAEIASRRAGIPQRLAAMKEALLQPQVPAVEPDHHCHTPYACPFWAHCTAAKPERWIFHLPGPKHVASRLAAQGVSTIDEIPDVSILSAVQRRVKENVEWISPKLGQALQSVQYPVHHVDFETVMLPVPRFPSTRPYQSIPVQWSNHIELESGEVVHREFLHLEPTEPRKRWAEALIETLGNKGSICVYSGYEEAMLVQLAEAFPEFRSAFREFLKRLWDLQPVIKEHYYHPAFQGSYSIKSVLPAVVPSLAYDDLAIQEGGQAANAYYRMVFVETDWVERATLREALLRYCARDTLAMLELRRILRAKAEGRE